MQACARPVEMNSGGRSVSSELFADWERRFFSRVRMTDGCWVWTGARNDRGYGQIAIPGRRGPGRLRYVHRVMYDLTVGDIPTGYDLDHLCRNPSCVRPDHLEAVTHRENSLRGISTHARNAAKTECLNGHPLDEENTYVRVDGTGWRQCKQCKSDRDAASRRRRGIPARVRA